MCLASVSTARHQKWTTQTPAQVDPLSALKNVICRKMRHQERGAFDEKLKRKGLNYDVY
jgi:hypothetical protein